MEIITYEQIREIDGYIENKYEHNFRLVLKYHGTKRDEQVNTKKEWREVIDEWYENPLLVSDGVSKCCCSHEIKVNKYATNRKNNKSIVLGKSCVKRVDNKHTKRIDMMDRRRREINVIRCKYCDRKTKNFVKSKVFPQEKNSGGIIYGLHKKCEDNQKKRKKKLNSEILEKFKPKQIPEKLPIPVEKNSGEIILEELISKTKKYMEDRRVQGELSKNNSLRSFSRNYLQSKSLHLESFPTEKILGEIIRKKIKKTPRIYTPERF